MKRLGVALAVVVVLAAAWLWWGPSDESTSSSPAAAEDSPASGTTVSSSPRPERMNGVLSQPVHAAANGHGTISGKVSSNGQPVATATVTATRAEGDETMSDLDCQCDNHCGLKLLTCGCAEASEQLKVLVVERRGEVVPLARTQTSADGTFELSGFGDGTVSLWADDVKLGTAFKSDIAVGATGIELELAGGIRIAGRAVIDGDEPAAGAWVTLIHADHSRFFDVIADPDGRFSIGPVPPAIYSLVAGKPGFLPGHEHLKKAPEGEVTVELSSPRRISGVVQRGEAPVAGVTVHLEGNHRKRDVVSAAGGTFAFDELRPGQYELTATQGELRASATVTIAEKGDPEPVVLPLDPGAVVAGRVHSRGRPIEGATVSLGNLKWAKATTDADGAFKLMVAVEPDQWLWVQNDGHAAYREKLELAPGVKSVDVELHPEALVRGTVIDAQSQAPLEGVDIQVTSQADAVSMDAVSTDGGAFEVNGLSAGRYRLKATDEEHLPATLEVTAPATSVRVAMAAGLSLHGVVVDEGGAGVAASVEVSSTGRYVRREVAANDAGEFVVRGLAPGRYEVEATAAKRRGSLDVTVPTKGGERVRVVLVAGLTLSGLVVDEDGKPVKDAFVYAVARAAGGNIKSSSDRTNREGKFELAVESAGEYELRAMQMGEGGPDFEAPTVTAKAGMPNVRLVVRKPRVIRGTVVNARHEPIKEFVVNSAQVKEPQGRFQANARRLPITLSFTAQGFLPVERTVTEAKGAVTDIGEVVLGSGRELTLTVLSKRTGKPLEGAVVWRHEDWLEQRSGAPFAQTDKAGRAILRGAPAEAVSFDVNHQVHRPQTVRFETTDTEKTVTLEKGPTLAIEVLDGEQHPMRAHVRAVNLDEKGGVVTVATDPSGRVRMEGMIPGRWLVTAYGARFDEGERATKTVTLAEEGEVSARLVMPAGSAVVELALEGGPGAWKPGFVALLPSEVPVAIHGTIDFETVFGAGYRGEPGDQPGTYVFSNVPPGRYQVFVLVEDQSRKGWFSVPLTVSAEPRQSVRVAPPAIGEVHEWTPRGR